MRVLVTGGTGFTGSALVRRLLDSGHQVVALDKQRGLAYEELRERGAEVQLGSVTDPEVVRRCMSGVDIVHHVAAAFREVGAPDSHYYEVNVNGIRTVLEAAEREGVRKFVYCSTCGVHGHVTDPPADEDSPIAPNDYYQETKYQAEQVVQEFADRGMATVILRPAAIYGPGDPGRFLMLFKGVERGWFPMFGSGGTLYHPLFLGNFLDAFELAMEPGRGDGGTYLIADEACPTIEELVREVADALDREVRFIRLPLGPLVAAGHLVEKVSRPFGINPPLFPRRVDWYRQDRAFDISRAKRELGYRPRVRLEEGLRIAAEWYREKGFLKNGGSRAESLSTKRRAESSVA